MSDNTSLRSTAVASTNIPEDVVPKVAQLEKVKNTIVFIHILLCMFMTSLNSTVVAPALSIIASDLNGLDKQTWIATSYLVIMNAFQPIGGRVST